MTKELALKAVEDRQTSLIEDFAAKYLTDFEKVDSFVFVRDKIRLTLGIVNDKVTAVDFTYYGTAAEGALQFYLGYPND